MCSISQGGTAKCRSLEQNKYDKTAEPLVPGLSHLDVAIAIAKLKNINRQVVIKFWQK
jgi:hypothetical protein